jgi:hypothetical protein
MANEKLFAEARTSLPDCRPAVPCDPRPVCAACGGLECLCRPRFFAGQLLSEEDLNRLDHYIVAKNRLHNRHLFGTGVSCGLEVVCSSCDPDGNGNVVVRPGYALSPCGNDIVVCKEEKVDICDLINRCRPRSGDDCFDPGVMVDDGGQGDEDWVLAICYQETASRGITALRGASCSCGGSCGCGGGASASGSSGGCGCGGGARRASAGGTSTTTSGQGGCGCGGRGGTASAKAKPAAKPGPPPPQCEPTLVCEGYSFAVYRVPPKDDKPFKGGALIQRFLCCLQPLIDQLQGLPQKAGNNNLFKSSQQSWLLDLRASIREFLVAEGLYDCDIAARLSAVAVPSSAVGFAAYQSQWKVSALDMLAVAAAILQKCFCAALLPPCPPAELNDCVPIATITVARGHCRVRHICNLSHRKFLTTFPSIRYWLSWLPFGQTFRELINALCCTSVSDLFNFKDADAINMTPQVNQQIRAAAIKPVEADGANPLSQLLIESLVSGEKTSAATLLLAAVGARTAEGQPLVSATALQYPGEAMLIQQVLAPMLTSLVPRGLAALSSDSFAAGSTSSSSNEKVDSLAAEITKLRNTVKRQQSDIDKLKKR